MDVEVDLYSGRENPHFDLEAKLATQLLRRVDSLEELAGPPQPRDALGYRGLIIDVGEASTRLSRIVVSNGLVGVDERTGARRLLADPGRELEGWLVDAGATTLAPDLLAFLREDLGT